MTSALAIGLHIAPPAAPGLLGRLPKIGGAPPSFFADVPNRLFAHFDGSGLAPLCLAGLGDVLTIAGEAQFVDDGLGGYAAIPANGVRASRAGLMDRMAGNNKCQNHNANPADLTNVTKTGDAAGVLSLVDDSAALAEAGLSAICASGMVYKLDNSGGSSEAQAIIEGFSGSTNTHTLSAFVRGSGTIHLHSGYEESAPISVSTAYMQQDWQTTYGTTVGKMWVRATAGSIVYFILNQMEELPYVTDPIVTTGASANLSGTRTVLPFAGGGFAFSAEMDLRGMRTGSTDGLLTWSDGSGDNRVCVNKNSSDALEAAWSRSGVSAGATGPAGTFGTGTRHIYGIMADGYARLGDHALGDGTAVNLGAVPNLTEVGLDGVGYDAVAPRAFKYLKKLAVWPVSTGADTVFAAVRAVAEDWAS